MIDLENVPIRDVGWARQHLTAGNIIRRRAWPDGWLLRLVDDTILQQGPDRQMLRWVIQQDDFLATDFELMQT